MSALDATQQGPHTPASEDAGCSFPRTHLSLWGPWVSHRVCWSGLSQDLASSQDRQRGLKDGVGNLATTCLPRWPLSIWGTSGMIWKSLLDPTSTPYSLRQTGLRLVSWINYVSQRKDQRDGIEGKWAFSGPGASEQAGAKESGVWSGGRWREKLRAQRRAEAAPKHTAHSDPTRGQGKQELRAEEPEPGL